MGGVTARGFVSLVFGFFLLERRRNVVYGGGRVIGRGDRVY